MAQPRNARKAAVVRPPSPGAWASPNVDDINAANGAHARRAKRGRSATSSLRVLSRQAARQAANSRSNCAADRWVACCKGMRGQGFMRVQPTLRLDKRLHIVSPPGRQSQAACEGLRGHPAYLRAPGRYHAALVATAPLIEP